MKTAAEEIEDIIADAYGDEEVMTSWEGAFQDSVTFPFLANFMDLPVEVQEFRLNNSNTLQCLIVKNQASKTQKSRCHDGSILRALTVRDYHKIFFMFQSYMWLGKKAITKSYTW